MQAEGTHPQTLGERQLLRNIGSSLLYNYLTPTSQRIDLGYIQSCVADVHNKQIYTTIEDCLLAVDCQMVDTDIGLQLCRVVIINQQKQTLYDKWFGIKHGTAIANYFTHITGISQQIFDAKMKDTDHYSELHREQIMSIIHHKILVGHDLANDLKMINITHQAFIDTVALLPHHFGLPFKNKLKDLAFQYLKKHIQWGTHDPVQDAASALEIVQKHIRQGRGTIQVQPFVPIHYNNDYLSILKDAQLDKQKVMLMVLRGSRAIGIQVSQAYVSDWDYVVVYDTDSELDGRLIKLPNVDISFFDKHSFRKHISNNDISYLEIFFLPAFCVYKNALEFPRIQLNALRSSLGFHLNKARVKSKRFQKQVKQKPYYQWKILKTHHLSIRFLDLWEQLYQAHKQLQNIQNQISGLYSQKKQPFPNQQQQKNPGIQFQKQINQKLLSLKLKKQKLFQKINIKRMNYLWYEIEKQFAKNNNFDNVLKKLQRIQAQKLSYINKIYDKSRMLRYRQGNMHAFKHTHRNKNQVQVEKMDEKKLQHDNEKINSLIDQNFHNKNDSSVQINPFHQSLQTIKFIRQYGVQSLQRYKIILKRHKIYTNLIQLHYMQSVSFNSKIARQCRGMIVDEAENYKIVALPYYKFFDYNDPKYSQIKELDWDAQIKTYEKKDGSMAVMYYYKGKWHVGSSTVPDGENNYCFSKHQTTTQFSKQFWSIFYLHKFELPSFSDRGKTFMFELMSKNHIIVVKRQHSQICLHGVRDIQTLQEEDHIAYGKKYNWHVAQPIAIEKQELNIESLVKIVEKLDPLKSEGYIVCDSKWTRVKIKNSSYVRINWLGELNLGFNKDPKRYILMQIILSGEAEVFCKYCPQWEKVVKEYLNKIRRLNQQIINLYGPISNLPKPQFAEKIKNYDKITQSFLFAIKTNPNQYYGKAETVLNPKKFYTYISQYNQGKQNK